MFVFSFFSYMKTFKIIFFTMILSGLAIIGVKAFTPLDELTPYEANEIGILEGRVDIYGKCWDILDRQEKNFLRNSHVIKEDLHEKARKAREKLYPEETLNTAKAKDFPKEELPR